MPHPSSWVLHSRHFTVDEDVAVPEAGRPRDRAAERVVKDAYRAVRASSPSRSGPKRSMGSRIVDNVSRLTPALQ